MENRSDVNRLVRFYTLKLLYGFCLGTYNAGTAVVNMSGNKIMEQCFSIFCVQKLPEANNIPKVEMTGIDSMIVVWCHFSYIYLIYIYFFGMQWLHFALKQVTGLMLGFFFFSIKLANTQNMLNDLRTLK